MPVKVFLVEGREILRQGIKTVLGQEPGIKIIGESSTEIEAFKNTFLAEANVILLDMNIPVPAILAFTKKVKQKFPAMRILVLTMTDLESSLTRILQGGVDGYVLKEVSKDELVFAIQKVNTEGVYMKPLIMVDYPPKNKLQSDSPNKPLPVLTDRESQVLDLIAIGLTNTQMAQKLFTSVRTIETRRKKLLQKTGALNTATLIRYAVVNGFIK